MKLLGMAVVALLCVGVGIGGTFTVQRVMGGNTSACSIASEWADSAFKTQEARPQANTQAAAEQEYQAVERIAALRHNACQ